MRIRLGILVPAALVSLSISVVPALAAGEGSSGSSNAMPPPVPSVETKKPTQKISKKKKPQQQKSEQQFIDGYKVARALVWDGQYEKGIAAFTALHRDGHPDVANYVGFANRKLGRYDDAKVWYEKALVADAGHTRTWQYYGLWHLEQGNRLKAEEHLEKIKSICGTGCDDYRTLKTALESGKIVY